MDDGVFADSFNTDYTTYGGRLDVGYKLALGSGGAFFEPLGTVSYGKTKFDDSPIPTLLGTGVDVQDSESLRTRLGGRLGHTIGSQGSTKIEPYVEGNWWHEFEGGYVTNLLSGGSTLPVTYNTKGDFGEVLGGISVSQRQQRLERLPEGGTQFGEGRLCRLLG